MAHALVIWLMIWHHLVADGKATGLADPPVANKARAGPLSIEVSLGTLTPAERGSSGNSLMLSSVLPNNSA